MSDMKQIINDSFTNYSGAVLQSRALVDVRDCVKPSARQIFYSMFQRKLTHDKPFKKTNNAISNHLGYCIMDAMLKSLAYRADYLALASISGAMSL